jgi:hypothetical protein
MPTEDPSIPETAAYDTAVRAPQPAAYAPVAEDHWIDDDEEELPRRPRRRLLAPVPVTLLGVLLIACGFIGGVLVEKGQTGNGTAASGSGLASRFAALRSAGASTGTGTGTATGTGAGGRAGGFGGFGGAGGATSGQVAYVVGSTLYVTTTEGNTVKVETSAASSVSKTEKSSVAAIHPGETVTVTGTTGKSGAVTAESIRVGSSATGGIGSLFGGGSKSGSESTSPTGGSEQSLFGKG